MGKSLQRLDKIDPIYLTKREFEVLKCISEGDTNSEIAEKLLISSKTVEGYKTRLMAKTNSKNSAHLILQAALNKLIEF